MSKNNKIYCVYCGDKNNNTDLKCKKCNKKLNPKEHLFRDYLYNHIKDDLKGKVEDNLFSIIKNYIISHLYGSSLIISILFTGVALIISNTSQNNVININKTSDMLSKNSNEVIVTIYTYDDYGEFEFNAPTTAGYLISGNKLKVENIKLKRGDTISDWCNNNSDDLLCNDEVKLYDDNLESTANDYKKLLSEYENYYLSNNCEKNFNKCSDKYIEYNRRIYEYIDKLTIADKDKIFDKNTKIDKDTELLVSYIGGDYEV